jgi:osmotically-inducible protein OsmY
MIRTSVRLALVVLCLLAARTALATEKGTDLTSVFVAGGVDILGLQVFEIDGVVLVRGRTSDIAQADEAIRLAASLGYLRVANLIHIVPGLADNAIEGFASRELKRDRTLEGCTFQVETRKGIVYLLGEVDRHEQKAYAVKLIRRIDGVRDVRSGLTLQSAPH